MSNTSILDIKVNAEEFYKFSAAFDKYKDSLKESEKHGIFGGGNKSQTNIFGKSLDSAKKAAKGFNTMLGGALSTLTKMGKVALSIAKSIKEFSFSLMKILGFGSVLSLAGITKLGASAVESRKESRGIGLTTGQTKSWTVNMGRQYVDLSAVKNMAGAQANSEQWPQLMMAAQAAGIPWRDAVNMSPDELTFKITQAAARRWNNENSSQRALDPYIKNASGLLGGTDVIRRAAKAGDKNLTSAYAQYKSDSSKFDIDDKTTDKWYIFTRQMESAGNQIQKVLTDKLSDLAPAIAKVIEGLTAGSEKLLNSILTPANLTAISDGITKFANYLSSPQAQKDFDTFKTNVSEFISDVGVLASAIHSAISFIKPTDKQSGANAVKKGDWFEASKRLSMGDFLDAANRRMAGQSNADIAKHLAGGSAARASMAKYPNAAAAAAGLAGTDKQFGLPQKTLEAMYQMETGSGSNVKTSKAGAVGPFQFMPSTVSALAKQGVNFDPMNYNESKSAAGYLMQQNMKIYKGDIRKAIGAYNLGTAGVNNAISESKKKGGDWLQYTPRETQNYVNNGMRIIINNNTSANVSTTANAAGF